MEPLAAAVAAVLMALAIMLAEAMEAMAAAQVPDLEVPPIQMLRAVMPLPVAVVAARAYRPQQQILVAAAMAAAIPRILIRPMVAAAAAAVAVLQPITPHAT